MSQKVIKINTVTETTQPNDIFCDSNCKTCDLFNKSKCLTCGQFAQLDSQQKCQCNERYYLKSNTPFTCIKCIPGCQSCKDSITCDICDQGTVDSNCSCPKEYYRNQDNKDICEKCPTNCESCQGLKCTKCLSDKLNLLSNCQCSSTDKQYDKKAQDCICIQGYFYQGSCQLNCPKGYFKDEIYKICVQCSSECIECEFTSTNCTQRYDCKLGFYKDTNDYLCKSCSPCLDCQNPNTCTTCIKEAYLLQKKCYINCPVGYYKNTSNQTCTTCNNACNSCIDSTAKCLDCKSSYYREIDTGLCVTSCKRQGYYQNSQSLECQVCHKSCLTCSGIEYNMCLECQENTFYDNQRCVNECPKLYLNKQCVDQCPFGYYQDLNKQCKKCSTKCLECIEKEDKCLKCQPQQFLFQEEFTCYKTCPDKYYANDMTQTCDKCTQGCSLCTNSEKCILCGYRLVVDQQGKCSNSCPQNTLEYKKQCVDSCPQATYQKQNSCFDCNVACLECQDDSNKCTKCSNQGYQLNDQCFIKCPDNYISDDTNRICQQCHTTCNSCKGTTEIDCLTCKLEYFYYGGYCINKCPKYTQDNQCVSECKSNYYLENIVCKQCHPFCTSCKDSTTECIECSDLAYKYNSKCQNSCPVGYYGDSITKSCELCHETCNQCLGPTSKQCLSCKEGRFFQNNECLENCKLLVYQGQCLKECPQKTFAQWTLRTCQNCSILCNQCEDETNECQECSSISYRYQDKYCYIECPDGTYPEKDKTCQPCDISCRNCTGGTLNNCISCDQNLFLVINQCLNQCPIGYYPQSGSNICIICDSNGNFRRKSFTQCQKTLTVKIEGVSDSWNKIKLEFSENIVLQNNDEKALLDMINITVQDLKKFNLSIQKKSSASYILTIETSQEFFEEKKVYISFKDPSKIKGIDGSVLSKDFSEENQKQLSDSDKFQSYLSPSISLGSKESLSSSSQTTVILLSGILLPIQIIFSQIISSLMVSIAQVLNYWMYIDMYLPQNLEVSLKMLKVFNLDFLPSIGDQESISSKISGSTQPNEKEYFGEKIIGQKARYRFEQRGQLTTSFMLNGMNKVYFILVIWLLNIILKKCMRYQWINRIQYYVDKFFVGFQNSTFIPLIFATILQLNNPGEKSIENVISFLFALITFLIVSVRYIIQIKSTYEIYKDRDRLQFDSGFKAINPIYCDQKLSRTSNQICFYFPHLLNLKDVLCIYLIITQYEFPQFILCSLFILQSLHLLAVIFIIQFEEQRTRLLNISNALLILIIVILFIIIYFLNIYLLYEDSDTKKIISLASNIGWGIIAIFLIMIVFNIIGMLCQAYSYFKQLQKQKKEKKVLENIVDQEKYNFNKDLLSSKRNQLKKIAKNDIGIKTKNQGETDFTEINEQYTSEYKVSQIEFNNLSDMSITNPNILDNFKSRIQSNESPQVDIQLDQILGTPNNDIKWFNNPLKKNYISTIK